MATLKIDLDVETLERLVEVAVQERRPIIWQAEILLMRALGVAFPRVNQLAPKPNESPEEGLPE